MQITVNGVTHEWTAHMIDYGVVLAMAGQPAGASVTYSGTNNGDMQRSGILHAKSQPIAVDDGMAFNVVRTNNG